MKTINKLLGAFFLLTFFATSAVAQSSATASTTAILVTPISISKTTDMHFGTVGASALAGTVVLDWADGRTTTGGATLAGGSPTSAVFNVVGEGSSTFSITIPTSPITLTSGANTMTVDNFTADLGAIGTLVGGTKDIIIGATLNVGAAQLAGTYFNASDLLVTVNYN